MFLPKIPPYENNPILYILFPKIITSWKNPLNKKNDVNIRQIIPKTITLSKTIIKKLKDL